MSDPTHCPVSLRAIVVLVCFVYACATYANLSFAIKSPADYRYFPPFVPHVDMNHNRDLAAENFNIARSMVAGKGFANPFPQPTGATAWMAPVLPGVLAALLWLCNGDRDAVMAAVVFIQINVLILTGLLILRLVYETCQHVGSKVALSVFFVGLLYHFFLCFQLTEACWLVLLAVDVVLAGFCWFGPLQSWPRAAVWGLVGGLCTLITPILGFAWGILSIGIAVRERAWWRLLIVMLAMALTLTPWVIRNWLVFGRFIPIKSNLGYELYQSQFLQPDGLLHRSTFQQHPYNATTAEGREYSARGEMAFVDRKCEQFMEAVSADPAEFLKRVGDRFLGATLWYVPFDAKEAEWPWILWPNRLVHPLPFIALLVILVTARRSAGGGLHGAKWLAIGIYVLYLGPYIVISYYERYAMPLIGVKVLLVVWAWEQLVFRALERRACPILPHQETVVPTPSSPATGTRCNPRPQPRSLIKR